MKYGIYITQSKYVKEIFKKIGLEDFKPLRTPMVTKHKFSKNGDSTKVNQTLYRSMLASYNMLYIADLILHYV